MKRELLWSKERMSSAGNEKLRQLDKDVNTMMRSGLSVREIINTVNENYELTDTEWTSFVYGMGFAASSFGAPPTIAVPAGGKVDA